MIKPLVSADVVAGEAAHVYVFQLHLNLLLNEYRGDPWVVLIAHHFGLRRPKTHTCRRKWQIHITKEAAHSPGLVLRGPHPNSRKRVLRKASATAIEAEPAINK